MNNNHDNRIVLNPSSISPIAVSQCLATNPNNGHCDTETLIDLESDVSTSLPRSPNHNAVLTHERQLHQIIRPSYNEPNAFHTNGGAQTALLSREYEACSNFRYSPPPPYDFYPMPSQNNIQPTPYPQQVLHFPQHQNVQYLQQQRLQYPQQESLQYHEEISDYPHAQRMPYQYRRDGNFPTLHEPPPRQFERHSCNTCLMVDTMCCCFCVLPICLLIFLLFFASTGL
ncbi:uncharacterized protein LOC119084594 [Bradysia coprophila]|uniref:uncharacterized protein LOC119084594 n=1 Tax=Bradysia coprophila TaxID=38358 RepID=UPI00187DD18B|nr:uncharacterized protein LOC119084594 [Bradysia coprophila]